MKLVPCVAVASLVSFTGAAHAQLFVESVGEPAETSEATNDLDLFPGGEISAVGWIRGEAVGFLERGYTVVHTPGGAPIVSWIVTDPDTLENELLGHRVDPVDKNQMILMEGAFAGPGATDTVVFKLDPIAGVLGYQWRYPMSSFGENLGVELDRETSLVAAAAVSPSSGASVPTLLRFDNATGLPVFHTRYPFFDQPVIDGRFFDVAVDRESGNIFAVGSIRIDDPERFRSGQGVLIARFDSMGFPVWLNVYEARRPGVSYDGHTGVSIELNRSGDVHVTARSEGPGISDAFHLTVSALAGVPIAANLFRDGDPFARLVPAYSSLELLPDGTMLASGTVFDDSGARPVQWNVDDVFGGFNWVYAPKSFGVEGTSAIEQPGEGLLLGGRWGAPSGTIGGIEDMLLARTAPSGAGYCDDLPAFLTGDPQVAFVPLRVDPESMLPPFEARLDLQEGNVVALVECDCPADLDGSGMLDFGDVSAFLTLFTNGDLRVDFDNSGSLDFADVSAFLGLFAVGCP